MKVYVNGDRLFSHMEVSAYLRCYNYYFFKYVLGLSESEFPEALILGIMFHSALSSWYNTGVVEIAEKAFMMECEKYEYVKNSSNALKENHPRSISNALDKLRTYCEVYKNDYFKPTGTEVEHFVKMEALYRHGIFSGNSKNNNNNKNNNASIIKSTPIYYVGHIDAVGKANGYTTFLEFKTTNLYSSSPLLESYTFCTQVKGYTVCIMDMYKLKEPCQGFIDLIYLRSKTREDSTLRYPLMFDVNQINNFKTMLSHVIGEILWKEKILKDFSLPEPSICTTYNRLCEYKEACDLLPNIELCRKLLLNRGFLPTLVTRLDKIEKEPITGKVPNKLYYTIEE